VVNDTSQGSVDTLECCGIFKTSNYYKLQINMR